MSTTVKILIGVIAALVVAGTAATIVILTTDPYKKAETAYMAEVMPFAANVIYLDGMSADYDVTYDMSGDFADLAGVEASSIGLSGSFAADSAGQSFSAVLSDDNNSIGAEYFMQAGQMIFSFPEISDYAFEYKLPENDDLPKLDMLSLVKTGTNISDYYFEMAKENGVYSKGVLVNGGEEFKCDIFELEFTGDMLYNLTAQSVEEIRANESLMDYLSAWADMAGEDVDDIIDEFLDGAESVLDDGYGKDTLFTMTVYIKGGKIIGRKLDNFYDSGETAFQYYDTEKGGRRSQYFYYNDEEFDGEYSQEFEYAGDFTVSGGKYTGEVYIVAKDYGETAFEITADVTDYKYYPVGGFAEGIVDLEITAETSKISVSIDMTKEGDTQFATIGADIEGTDIGELTYMITLDSSDPEITMPEISSKYLIDIENIGDEGSKFTGFLTDVYDAAAGLDQDGLLYYIIVTAVEEVY
jgi:hypothetical protein